jgi:hypothetical protein
MVAYARSCCTYCAKCGSAHYLCNLRYWIPSLCLDNSLVLLWLSLCGFACHLLRMRLQWSMSNCEARVRSWIDFSLDHRSLNEAWCERGAAGQCAKVLSFLSVQVSLEEAESQKMRSCTVLPHERVADGSRWSPPAPVSGPGPEPHRLRAHIYPFVSSNSV